MGNNEDSSDSEVDVTNDLEHEVQQQPKKVHKRKRAWKPKFHIPLPGASQGVTAAAARPHFSSSEGEDDELLTSGGELASSDLDTDFSADENPQPQDPEMSVMPKIKSPILSSVLMMPKQNKTKQNKATQTKQNKTKQNKTKQNKTKQNKTKQHKTKQNKTKQNKTHTHSLSQ